MPSFFSPFSRFSDHVGRRSVVFCLAFLFLLDGYSAIPAEPAPPPYRVGVLYWSMNIPGQVAMREGLEAEAAAINIRARETGARPVELLPQVAGEGDEGIERQLRAESQIQHTFSGVNRWRIRICERPTGVEHLAPEVFRDIQRLKT